MKYHESDTRLIVTVDAEERETLLDQLAADPIAFGWDTTMYDFFEELIANSELEWIEPETALRFCGDLTDAPMLGMWVSECGCPECPGCATLKRWAFMDYQVKGVLQELADNGKVIFIA